MPFGCPPGSSLETALGSSSKRTKPTSVACDPPRDEIVLKLALNLRCLRRAWVYSRLAFGCLWPTFRRSTEVHHQRTRPARCALPGGLALIQSLTWSPCSRITVLSLVASQLHPRRLTRSRAGSGIGRL